MALVARSDEGLRATQRACLEAAPGADVLCCAVDVCKPRAARTIVEATVRHFGRVTALVNNVGVNLQQALSAGCHGERAADEAAATLKRVLDVNLGSVMELTMEALPHLLRNALVTNGGKVNDRWVPRLPPCLPRGVCPIHECVLFPSGDVSPSARRSQHRRLCLRACRQQHRDLCVLHAREAGRPSPRPRSVRAA